VRADDAAYDFDFVHGRTVFVQDGRHIGQWELRIPSKVATITLNETPLRFVHIRPPRYGYEPVRLFTDDLTIVAPGSGSGGGSGSRDVEYTVDGSYLEGEFPGAFGEMDGIEVEVGDRFLFNRNKPHVDNGIYEFIRIGTDADAGSGSSGSGSTNGTTWLARRTWDADDNDDFEVGFKVVIQEGEHAGQTWRLIQAGTVNTTAQYFINDEPGALTYRYYCIAGKLTEYEVREDQTLRKIREVACCETDCTGDGSASGSNDLEPCVDNCDADDVTSPLCLYLRNSFNAAPLEGAQVTLTETGTNVWSGTSDTPDGDGTIAVTNMTPLNENGGDVCGLWSITIQVTHPSLNGGAMFTLSEAGAVGGILNCNSGTPRIQFGLVQSLAAGIGALAEVHDGTCPNDGSGSGSDDATCGCAGVDAVDEFLADTYTSSGSLGADLASVVSGLSLAWDPVGEATWGAGWYSAVQSVYTCGAENDPLNFYLVLKCYAAGTLRLRIVNDANEEVIFDSTLDCTLDGFFDGSIAITTPCANSGTLGINLEPVI
jgi:hypothetical protein